MKGGTFEKRDAENHSTETVSVESFIMNTENFSEELLEKVGIWNMNGEQKCNRLSISMGFQPYYFHNLYTNEYFTNDEADGFRLPTDDELAYFDYKYGKDDTRKARIVKNR